MVDDSTAEKKATDRLEMALDPDKRSEGWTRLMDADDDGPSEVDDLRAVIADAREVESLREQLAAAKRKTQYWTDAFFSLKQGVESDRIAALAEAQATIERVREFALSIKGGCVYGYEIIQALSAPSSTGGNDILAVDPGFAYATEQQIEADKKWIKEQRS